MHQKAYPLGGSLPTEREQPEQFIDLERLLAMGARRAKVIVLGAAVGLLLGVLYLVFTPSEYTAVTDVLIDESLAKYAQDTDNPAPLPSQIDALVLSEVEIMKSERLARTVAAALKLDRNEAFLYPPQSPVDWARSTVRSVIHMVLPQAEEEGAGGSVQDARMRRAVQILQSNLDVNRVGRSYVIELSYQSNDRQLAGAIARAYADKYLSDQLDANFNATERASVWLQGRIADLRTRSQAAALDVQRYRAAHGLTAASGELISDQQLSDLNKQLVLAQADTANALARYNQFKAIVDSGPDNAVKNATVPSDKDTGSSGNNNIINQLKGRYLDITKREQEIASRFGENHPQAVALREQQADLAKQIYQELQRLTESYRNQYEVAKAREDSLRQGVAGLASRSTEDDQSMVQLRELEQNADALAALYKDFLSRHEQATQQGSFPIAKARVISQAADPVSPSSPRKVLVLGLSLVLGLFAGAGVGGLQEFRERFFRTGEDIRDALDLDFFGYLPLVNPGRGGPAVATERAEPGTLELPPILQVATEAASSSFAETLRSAKLGVDIVLQGKNCKVISFLSVLPREGKTTVAANFAQLCAASGARTLLIDGDLRNPGLSRSLALEPEAGLVEVIVGEERWQNVVKVSPRTRLSVMPTVLRGRLSHTSELLSGPGMLNVLNAARNVYNYIIVDLPPFGPVVDAKAFEPSVDAFVLVTEWGATPRNLVRTALQTEPRIAEKVLGAILNKTDMKALGRYGGYGSSERYLDRYSPYYTEPGEAA